MVPFAPTITIVVPEEITLDSVLAVPEACNVHVAPSVEVTIVPELPTVMNCAPSQAMPENRAVLESETNSG